MKGGKTRKVSVCRGGRGEDASSGLTSINSEKGTQAATAQQAPTAATMTVDCQTVLTKKVRNLNRIEREEVQREVRGAGATSRSSHQEREEQKSCRPDVSQHERHCEREITDISFQLLESAKTKVNETHSWAI